MINGVRHVGDRARLSASKQVRNISTADNGSGERSIKESNLINSSGRENFYGATFTTPAWAAGSINPIVFLLAHATATKRGLFLLPDKIVCFMALRMVFDVLEVKQRRPLRESVLHCSSHLHNSFTRRCPSQMHHLGPSGFHS